MKVFDRRTCIDMYEEGITCLLLLTMYNKSDLRESTPLCPQLNLKQLQRGCDFKTSIYEF